MVARAAVHGDNEGDLVVFGVRDEFRTHAVAVGKTIGEYDFDVVWGNTGKSKCVCHYGASGNTVDIVIAIDKDSLLGFDGLLDAGDGLVHVVKSKRVYSFLILGMQKIIGEVAFLC